MIAKIPHTVAFILLLGALSFLPSARAATPSDTKETTTDNSDVFLKSLKPDSASRVPKVSSSWQGESNAPQDIPEVWVGKRIQERLQNEYGMNKSEFGTEKLTTTPLDILSPFTEDTSISTETDAEETAALPPAQPKAPAQKPPEKKTKVLVG